MKKIVLIIFFNLVGCLKNNLLNLNKTSYKISPYDNKITKLVKDYLEAKKNGKFDEAKIYLQQLKNIILNSRPSEFSEKTIKDIAKEIEKYTFRKIKDSKGNVIAKPNYGFETLNDTFISYPENYNKLLNNSLTKSWFELIDLKKEYIEVLLEAGVPVNMENAFGENLLHKACYEGDLDLVNFLIKKGINVNKQDKRLGFTPIFFCIKNFNDRSFNIIERLIEEGASLLIIDNENKTILHHFYKTILLLASRVNKNMEAFQNFNNYHNLDMNLYIDLIKFFKISLKTILEQNPELIFIKDNKDENTFYDHFFDPSLKDTIKNLFGIELTNNTLSENFFYDHIAKKNRKSFIDFLVLLSGRFFDEDLIKKCLCLYEIKFEEDEKITFKNKIVDLSSTLEINTLVWYENKQFIKCLFKIFEEDNIQALESTYKLKIILEKALVLKKYEIVNMFLIDPDFSKFNLLRDIDYLEYNMRRVNLLNHIIEWGKIDLFDLVLPFSNINLCDDVLFQVEGDVNLNTTPLSNIIKRDNMKMFDLIIKKGDLNLFERDHIGYTCFHYAAEFNRLEMFKKLIEILEIKMQQNLIAEELFLDIDETIEVENPLTIVKKRSKKIQDYNNFTNYINSLDIKVIRILKHSSIEVKLQKGKDHLTDYESLTENLSYFNIVGIKKPFFDNFKKIIEAGKKNEEKFWLDYEIKFPLHYSIINSNVELFNNNLLPIWFDSDRNQDWDGKNPLHIAVEKSNEEIIKRFLRAEYNLVSSIFKNREIRETYQKDMSNENLENLNRYNQNTSPFNKAIDLQNINILNLFLNYVSLKGIDENFKIDFLEYALSKQKFKSFEIIYKSISEANKKNFSQQILINTIKKVMDEDKNPKIIDSLEFLLKYYPKENINLNSKENNPLLLVIEKENEFLIDFLISHGADPKAKDDKGIPISYYLLYDLYKKNKKLISKFLNIGAFDVNTSNEDNPLHFYIENILIKETNMDEDFFKFMINKFNYCLHKPNIQGFFPLHLFLSDRKGLLLKLLNEGSINFNKQDYNGNNFLHVLLQDWISDGPNSSLKYCSLNIIKTLFEITDMNLKNAKGKSCMDYIKNKVWEKYGKKYARRSLDKDLKNKIKELRKLIEKFKK